MPDLLSFQDNLNKIFARVRFILEKTSHPGNVGASARALKTMGFQDLVLISPKNKEVRSMTEATVRAASASDVLGKAKIVENFPASLDGVNYCIGLSARKRSFKNVCLLPREAVQMAVTRLLESSCAKIAFVFGNEQSGLSNEILLSCQEQWFIPSNQIYSSLNLSAAVQIIAYEMRVAILENFATLNASQVVKNFKPSPHFLLPLSDEEVLAGSDELLHLFYSVNALLNKIGFGVSDISLRGLLRLRQLIVNAKLSRDDISLLQGILKRAERRLGFKK